MTISKKHLIQLVQIYKKAHMEYELIRTELIRNRLNDDVLKMELEAFGKRNCKNFNDLIFSTALDIAEKQNKEEHENIKAIRKETQRNLDLKDNI